MRRVRLTIVAVQSSKYDAFSVCVCSPICPARKAYEPYYIALCDLSSCTVFFYIISYTTRFLKKEEQVIEHKISVVIYPTSLCETFLVLRRLQRDFVIRVHWICLLVKCPLFSSDFE